MSTGEQLKPYQFQKGQSGNPKGKPKGTLDLKSRIEKILLETSETVDPVTGKVKKTKEQNVDAMIRGVLKRAASSGDSKSFNAIVERVDGKVETPIAITQSVNPEETEQLLLTAFASAGIPLDVEQLRRIAEEASTTNSVA